MLFDLQSRGRRTVVKIIYVWLAILMGGGLILFGIGTGTGGGGLLDIFTDSGQSTSSQVSDAEKQANRAVRLRPQDPQAWGALARARYQTAGQGGNYDPAANEGAGAFTEQGREKLESAVAAWQRYLDLDPRRLDPTLAQLMANAYADTGLGRPAEAAEAMEVVTELRPSASAYATLADYAYRADQLRKGDLAAAKAVQLAPEAQRRLLRSQLILSKRNAIRAAAEDAIRNPPASPRGGERQGVG